MLRETAKYLLLFLIPSIVKADQLVYVTKDQAQQAKEIILSQKQVILACTCCNDTSKTYINVFDVVLIRRDNLYSVEIEGETRYAKHFSGFIDLAYCFTEKRGYAVSIAKQSNFSSQLLHPDCFKSFSWWFPATGNKYWENISNGELSLLSQQIPIHLDSSNHINFMTKPSAAYLGMHADTAEILVNPVSLDVVLAYHEKETAFCNYIAKLPYYRLAYHSSSSDNPLPVALAVNGEHFEMESASITFSNKEGDVRELSTLSPYFFARFNAYLEEVPLQDAWMRKSLFPENYPQGMIKVDEAKFRSTSNSNQIAVLKDFCIVPVKSVEE
jgi:hypothetical protein